MTKGNYCSVAICTSHSIKAKNAGEHLIFFTFPKDPFIRKLWILNCYRKDKFNPNTGRICSRHFTSEDYEDALRAQLMEYKPKRLKKTAIPSLHLLPVRSDALKHERLEKCTIKKERKEVEEEMAQQSMDTSQIQPVLYVSCNDESGGPQYIVPNFSGTATNYNNTECDNLRKKLKMVESENKRLTSQNKALKRKNEILEEGITLTEHRNKILKQKLSDLESMFIKVGKTEIKEEIEFEDNTICIQRVFKPDLN